MNDIEQIQALLQSLSADQRQTVFKSLRREFPINPLEKDLNISAEVVLESIRRAGGLTLRMIRGVIAETVFHQEVIQKLNGWRDVTPDGDLAYDAAISDGDKPVTIQVKLQRSEKGMPKVGKRKFRGMYQVETQKTRGGERDSEGIKIKTRPYRYGEFDILSVCMYPSTGNWSDFRYTVGDWLLPNPKESTEIGIFQPIPQTRNDDWTDDLEECIGWFRSGAKKRIKDKDPIFGMSTKKGKKKK